MSLGAIRVQLDMTGNAESVSRTLQRLHKTLSSERKDVFGIANHPEGNAFLAAVRFEIIGETEVTEAVHGTSTEWYEAQKITCSNADLITVDATTGENNVVYIYGFVVDEVTRTDYRLYGRAKNDECFHTKVLFCDSGERRLNNAGGEWDNATDTGSFDVKSDTDTESLDTFLSSSYITSDDDIASGDDVTPAVESGADDRPVTSIDRALQNLLRRNPFS